MSNSRPSAYDKGNGLKHEIERLRQMIRLALAHAPMFESLGIAPPRVILLSGPANMSCSLMERLLTEAIPMTFFSTSGPEILSRYFHHEDPYLPKLFEQALQSQPAVIFIDELEHIASKHAFVTTETEKHIAADLLTLLDRLEPHAQVVVIGASAQIEAIDPIFRRHGRFTQSVELPLPDHQMLKEILHIYLRERPLADDVDLEILAELANGFSGMDVEAACQMAATYAVTDYLLANPPVGTPVHITHQHLATAITELCMQKLEEK